jgi:DNA-binding NtrC family response regulator
MLTSRSPNIPIAAIVEDMPLLRMQVRETVEELGFEAREAASVAQAIAIIEEMARPLSLLVTDVEMPGERHGLGLAWEIHERWPVTRILIVSGNMSFAAEQLPPGALFLAKPFGPAGLKACVHALFNGPRHGSMPVPSGQPDLTRYC